jgi:6-phosphogluconolactonase
MPLELQVYPTDAEAFEATAALAATHLRGAHAHPSVALSGGRSGRGVMLALAARGELPWDRIEWFWGDERCVPPDDPRSNLRVARDSLLGPRGVAAARIHAPPLELGDAGRIAATYGATLAEHLGATPILDILLLGIGSDGHLASLMPGGAALRASAPVAAVPVEEVTQPPHVERITVTPAVVARARAAIVTVTGEAKAAAVAAAMADDADPERIPAALVRPSTQVAWVIDRAAASVLLRGAQPA